MDMVTNESKKDDHASIIERIDALENRVNSLENALKGAYRAYPYANQELDDESSLKARESYLIGGVFETGVGEYGLAWLGNIVLFLAIGFLFQHFVNIHNPLLAIGVGITSVITVFGLSYILRVSYTYLSKTFNIFGFIILFFLTLKLHFYNKIPIIDNVSIATIIIIAVIAFQIFWAVKKENQFLAGLAYLLGLFGAFTINDIHLFFGISLALICFALYSYWRYSWLKSFMFILIISYLFFLVWMLKNKVLLFNPETTLAYYTTFVYISVATAIYSLLAFKKPDESRPSAFSLMAILTAGIEYSIVLLVLVLVNSQKDFVPLFAAITIYSILYSIFLKLYSPLKYSPALYALFGFVGFSIAVYGIFMFPDSFLLLIIQSLLVLIIALWYQSQVITLINTFLFFFIVLFYYKSSGTLQLVNFSIPLVAFLSARFINWKKERLNIKTEFIRNLYLFILFASLLYATAKGIPAQFVTIGWLVIAGGYFGLSVILNNRKYRLMAMANLFMSFIHLMIFDMAKSDVVFRILAFIAFAAVSLVISIYYVKKIKRKDG